MKHGFTDDQINEAIMQANQTSRVYSWETEMYRNVINHLLTPASDEWIECAFEDIQKGDRVKWVYQDKDREQVITGIAHRLAYGDEAWVTESYAIIADISIEGQFYRIPAPAQHPDPEQYPVIIIYRPNGNGETPVSYAWTGQHYRSFDGQEYFSANEITDWSPAKVVADDDPVRPEDVGF